MLRKVLQNAQNPFFLKFEGLGGLNRGLENFPRLDAPLRCARLGRWPFNGRWVKTTNVSNFFLFLQPFGSDFDHIF